MKDRVRRVATRQDGAIAIMFAGLLIVIFAFFALALDLSRVYNRRAELQSMADYAAVAAAGRLNGTAAGVVSALAAAKANAEDASYGPLYAYTNRVTWTDAAIMFSASPDSGWVTSGDASASDAAASNLIYAKVDTSKLGEAYGNVGMLFMPVLSSAFTSIDIGHTSVAGKTGINVTPFAVCAMSTTAYASRNNGTGYEELVEYGFRRGVGYNLMNLNPNATSPVNFLVDPISTGDDASPATHFAASTVGPFLCTGTMAVPKVVGATVKVQSSFSLSTYAPYLNSRFDTFTGGECDSRSAPPDTNIKQFTPSIATWAGPRGTEKTAKEDKSGGKLRTVADLDPADLDPKLYGPLWTFAHAVPWSSYVAGQPEPAGGYLPFAATTAVWNKLYSTTVTVSGYPTAPPSVPSATFAPYQSSTYTQQPSLTRPGAKYRRVLNVPLLSCPVAGATAQVVAIGRFFMTVPADGSGIYAEFAGLAADTQVSGPVGIYQ
jgi:Flp pilus assembly protein TadG